MSKRAFIKYSRKGKLLPGFVILSDKRPKGNYLEVPLKICCTTPLVPTDGTKRAYVRYNRNGDIIPTNIIIGNAPRFNNYLEIPLSLCCILKYIVYFQEPPTNNNEIVEAYSNGTFLSGDIEAIFNVGTPGIANVHMFYSGADVFFDEIINVDTTSSDSFWADIVGWLLLNDFANATYVSLSDKWLTDNPYHYVVITEA